MNPNTLLYVTNKGAILMKGGVLKTPGQTVTAGDFKGIEANLETLLAAGNLSLTPVTAQTIDVDRGPDQLPGLPIAKEGETLDADKTVRITAGNDEQATRAKVAEIKAATEAKAAEAKAEAEKRQKLLADLSGADLTPEEAKALGVIS